MAPIITATELKFKPTEATRMEQTKIQTAEPLNSMFCFMPSIVPATSASPCHLVAVLPVPLFLKKAKK